MLVKDNRRRRNVSAANVWSSSSESSKSTREIDVSECGDSGQIVKGYQRGKSLLNVCKRLVYARHLDPKKGVSYEADS